MSDDPVLVERLLEFGFEKFHRKRRDTLEKAVIISVGAVLVVAVLVFVLTGSVDKLLLLF